MIISFFLNTLFICINFLLNFLPNGSTFPSDFTTGISTVYAAMKAWSFIIPWSAIIISLGISFSWIFFVFAWDLIHWVLRKIPALNIK